MSKENRTPYHLTITDNKTGETLHDMDFSSLLAGVGTSNEESGCLAVYSCPAIQLSNTARAAETLIERECEEDKDLAFFLNLHRIFDKEHKNNDDEMEGE